MIQGESGPAKIAPAYCHEMPVPSSGADYDGLDGDGHFMSIRPAPAQQLQLEYAFADFDTRFSRSRRLPALAPPATYRCPCNKRFDMMLRRYAG